MCGQTTSFRGKAQHQYISQINLRLLYWYLFYYIYYSVGTEVPTAGLQSLIKSWTANVWSSPTPAFNLKNLSLKTHLQHIYLQNTFGFIHIVPCLSVWLKNWTLDFSRLTKPKYLFTKTHMNKPKLFRVDICIHRTDVWT